MSQLPIFMLTAHWRARIGPVAQGGLFYFGVYAASAAYIPFLAVYLAHAGLTGSEIGLLTAIGPLASFLLAPALISMAEQRGRRVRVLSLALAGTALFMLLVPLNTSFIWLLLVVGLLTALRSPVGPLADSVLARMANRKRLAYGQMRLWGSLGWAVVAALGGLLWQQVGFFLMFPVASGLLLATILAAQLFEEEPAEACKDRPGLKMVTADSRLMVLIASTAVLGLSIAMVGTFSGIYMDQLGGGQTLVGLYAGVKALCELPTMRWSEGIVRRLGGAGALLLSFVLVGISYLGLAWIRQPELLLISAAVQGLGFGIFLPITVRQVAAWAPAGASATCQSFLSAGIWGLGPLIAGPLGGIIYDTSGAIVLFLISAGVAVAAGLVLVLAQLGGVFKEKDELRKVRQPVPG